MDDVVSDVDDVDNGCGVEDVCYVDQVSLCRRCKRCRWCRWSWCREDGLKDERDVKHAGKCGWCMVCIWQKVGFGSNSLGKTLRSSFRKNVKDQTWPIDWSPAQGLTGFDLLPLPWRLLSDQSAGRGLDSYHCHLKDLILLMGCKWFFNIECCCTSWQFLAASARNKQTISLQSTVSTGTLFSTFTWVLVSSSNWRILANWLD